MTRIVTVVLLAALVVTAAFYVGYEVGSAERTTTVRHESASKSREPDAVDENPLDQLEGENPLDQLEGENPLDQLEGENPF